MKTMYRLSDFDLDHFARLSFGLLNSKRLAEFMICMDAVPFERKDIPKLTNDFDLQLAALGWIEHPMKWFAPPSLIVTEDVLISCNERLLRWKQSDKQLLMVDYGR